ncbi:hypothetical protein GN956_G24991 [Arapaima gigas]
MDFKESSSRSTDAASRSPAPLRSDPRLHVRMFRCARRCRLSRRPLLGRHFASRFMEEQPLIVAASETPFCARGEKTSHFTFISRLHDAAVTAFISVFVRRGKGVTRDPAGVTGGKKVDLKVAGLRSTLRCC